MAGKLVEPEAEDEADGDGVDPDKAKKDEEERAFWDTIKAKGWVVNTSATKGNPVGGRWARAIAKTVIKDGKKVPCQLAQDYRSCANDDERKEFRSKWAQGEWSKYEH
eukprot:4674148-Pyramimonas_sp.AAC.1